MPAIRRPLVLLVAALSLASAFRPKPAAAGREVRELPAFTAVSLGTSVRVVVRQGSPQQVVVEAAPDDLPRLQTEVTGAQLRIARRQPGGLLSGREEMKAQFHGPVTVFVTLPTVRSLACSSSGQLAVAHLQADTLQAAVSGSGALAVAGTCAYATLGISSSGHLNGADLAVQDCRARLSGSGSGQLQVARTLEARLSSSGSLLVRGNPQIDSRCSGSGRVRRQE